jgi:hypothetical protein
MSDKPNQYIDPFQAFCQRTVGRDMALRYKDVVKLTGYDVTTLYNAKNSGELVPINPQARVFHWPSVKQFMQSKGRWA